MFCVTRYIFQYAKLKINCYFEVLTTNSVQLIKLYMLLVIIYNLLSIFQNLTLMKELLMFQFPTVQLNKEIMFHRSLCMPK